MLFSDHVTDQFNTRKHAQCLILFATLQYPPSSIFLLLLCFVFCFSCINRLLKLYSIIYTIEICYCINVIFVR
jgi:hypothetical protein